MRCTERIESSSAGFAAGADDALMPRATALMVKGRVASSAALIGRVAHDRIRIIA